jgi:hypothetical protein
LKALPDGRLDYRPDPKARTAAQLAWMLVSEEAALLSLLESGTIDWRDTPPPARVSEIVAAFERDSAIVNAKLEKLDEAGWARRASSWWKALRSGRTRSARWSGVSCSTRSTIEDSSALISAPWGGKVPSIYGPTADDPG